MRNRLFWGRPRRASKTARESGVQGLPTGKIGKVTISRLICGGNLIGGWAHSRDLIYVSSLLKQYFTDEKICDTLEICEENGINTINAGTSSLPVLRKYWDERGGKIQWLAQCVTQARRPRDRREEGHRRRGDRGVSDRQRRRRVVPGRARSI